MDKPLSLIVNDFRGAIERAIGACGLPPIITAPIMENYAMQLRIAARDQTVHDAQEWKEGE